MTIPGLSQREDGASAVEYGMLVAAIAATLALIVFAMGGMVRDAFTGTCTEAKSQLSTTSTC